MARKVRKVLKVGLWPRPFTLCTMMLRRRILSLDKRALYRIVIQWQLVKIVSLSLLKKY